MYGCVLCNFYTIGSILLYFCDVVIVMWDYSLINLFVYN